jgi:hypothetical protein
MPNQHCPTCGGNGTYIFSTDVANYYRCTLCHFIWCRTDEKNTKTLPVAEPPPDREIS